MDMLDVYMNGIKTGEYTRTRSGENEYLCLKIAKTSPARKYEVEGGPAISRLMKELLGAQNAIHDRETFMRTQVLFWILGATDGHAKNFSIFIDKGDQYRLTPLYDILSAFPAVNKNGLHEKDLKRAYRSSFISTNVSKWITIVMSQVTPFLLI